MALLKQIQQRYSVRSYQKRPVEKEKLETILQSARLAPSANNKQEWRFIVVQDADTRRQLCVAANNQAFVGEAPVVIVCCSAISDYVMRCGHLAYPIDVAIAMEHIALQAVEEGLGTCWVGSFYEDQVKAILGIPSPGTRGGITDNGLSGRYAPRQEPLAVRADRMPRALGPF